MVARAAILRREYAETFVVPIADVAIEWTSDTDVRIVYRDPRMPTVRSSLPTWTFEKQPGRPDK